jgi:molybdenum cofactor biosynthesis protein B
MPREKTTRRRLTPHLPTPARSRKEWEMSVEEHRAVSPRRVRVALVTVSDTRTEDNDTAGRAARALVEQASHEVASYRILRDEPDAVAAHVRALCETGGSDVEAVVTCGGTGLSARDRTFEALHGLFEREIPGFGELFRMLSFAQIGAAAMLSRASAGLYRGVPIFACPGSEAAVRLALERLILPELGHIVREARR